MKTKLLLAAVLILAGFLLGFIPQYSKASRSSSELAAATQELATCRFDAGLCSARELLAMSYLEANRKNYGTAREYSTRFFDQSQKLLKEARSEKIKTILQEVLRSRDRVTAALASGDPASTSLLEALMIKTY